MCSSNCDLVQNNTVETNFAIFLGNICTMGGTIGFASTDIWKPYTIEDREKHASMLQNFEKSLKPGHSEKTQHEKKLQFMAENGIRGFGPSRIGVFADKQRPEPLHCEINAWQLVINIVYQESVQRNVFDQFIKVLGVPLTVSATHNEVTETDGMPVLGCGLLFLVPFFQDHYKDDKVSILLRVMCYIENGWDKDQIDPDKGKNIDQKEKLLRPSNWFPGGPENWTNLTTKEESLPNFSLSNVTHYFFNMDYQRMILKTSIENRMDYSKQGIFNMLNYYGKICAKCTSNVQAYRKCKKKTRNII